MKIRALILIASGLFLAFMLEHLPMPDLLLWLQPAWVLMVVTLLVMSAPQSAGLWIALPLGLMLDAEQNTLLGTHVLTLTIHIYLLQLLYRRMVLFNFVQQTGVVFLLVVVQQLLVYWAGALVSETMGPVPLWGPALTSALVWPWMYGLTHIIMVRLHLT